ncbi:MAG: Fic family protein [Peptococcaceae bacterium]|nr:Fic family protein [Peptococcaceae bacterium]
MDYIFKKWYMEKDKSPVEDLYRARFNGETTRRLDLSIRPMGQDRIFPLYFVPTAEMMQKMEEVYYYDEILTQLVEILPAVAHERFFADVIADELQSSNEIEGVHSNRQDIAASARALAAGERPPSPRMNSMITTYLALRDDEGIALPKTPADIRALYDRVTEGEIDADNLPDGKIFVREGAEVSGAAYGKLLHRGVQGEAAIIAHIEALLQFLADESLPLLIRLAIGHYYFGYIHPFYDGNGRTSRFLTSLYLSKQLSLYTANSFAKGCRLEHRKYLDMFEKANRFNGYGEMNVVIDGFLNILLAGQDAIGTTLGEKGLLLALCEKNLALDPELADDGLAREAAMLLCQAMIYSDGTFTQQALTAQMQAEGGHKRTAIRRALDALEAQGRITRVKGKPITYALAPAWYDQLMAGLR